MLSEKDDSLGQAARNAPAPKIEKRRSSTSTGGNNTPNKKRKSSTISHGSSSNAGEGTTSGKNAADVVGSSSTTSSSKQQSRKSKSELAERELRGMENLTAFITEKEGGDREMVEKYRCRVTIKPSDGRFDVNFFNEHGKRFRSMIEVGRFLNLVDGKSGISSTSGRSAAAAAGIGNLKKKRKRGAAGSSTNSSSVKQIEAEKK